MLNLKKMLTKVLSLTPMFEYVGTVNQIHWSSWTAPDDGIVIMDVGWLTGGGFGYYYVQDATEGINVGKVTTYSVNGTSNTTSFPVIKGHTYKDSAIQNVQGSSFYFRYYKIKFWGGYLTSKFYETFSHLERWWEYVRLKGVVGENITKANKYWNNLRCKRSNKYHKCIYRFSNKRCIPYTFSGNIYIIRRMALQHTLDYWYNKFTNCVQKWRKRQCVCDGESVCRWQQLELIKNEYNPNIRGYNDRIFVCEHFTSNNKLDKPYKLDSSHSNKINTNWGCLAC